MNGMETYISILRAMPALLKLSGPIALGQLVSISILTAELTPQTLFVSVCLLPLIPLGVVAGKWMATKLSSEWFYHISHVTLGLLALRLVIGWLMS